MRDFPIYTNTQISTSGLETSSSDKTNSITCHSGLNHPGLQILDIAVIALLWCTPVYELEFTYYILYILYSTFRGTDNLTATNSKSTQRTHPHLSSCDQPSICSSLIAPDIAAGDTTKRCLLDQYTMHRKSNNPAKDIPIEIKQCLQIHVPEKFAVGLVAFLVPAGELTGLIAKTRVSYCDSTMLWLVDAAYSVAIPEQRAFGTLVQRGCMFIAAVTASLPVYSHGEMLDAVAQQ